MGRRRALEVPWGRITRVRARDGRTRFRLRGRVEGRELSCGLFDTLEAALVESAAYAERLAGVPDGLTVAGWGARWLERVETTGRMRSVRDLRAVWDRYVIGSKLEHMLLRQVHSRHVLGWLHEIEGRTVQRGKRKGEPLRRQTVRNALYALSAACKAAVQSGKLSSNPCHGVETSPEARTDDPTTVLSLDEIRTLLSYRKLPEKQRTAYTVAIYSGLREGELWGLRWEDVHLEGADPHVAVRYGVRGKPTKGGRPRIVPLLPPALSALRAWRSRGGVDRRFGYVFVGPSGLPHATGYDAGWADVRKRRKKRVVVTPGWKTRAGIARGVRFHDLRHTCGAHLVMGSWGKAWRLEELQVLLGHASRTTTERYAKYLPGNLHSVAAESRAQWVGFGHHSGTGPSPPKR